MDIEKKIQELGWILPDPPKALAVYKPAMRTGNLVFTSGQLPLRNGNLLHTGKLGKDVSIEIGKEEAKTCVLNALSVIKQLVGDLNSIQKIVKMGVFVASVPDFEEHHLVANGGSEALERIFGELGSHSRFAVGVNSLPLDASVELELIVEVNVT